MALIHAGEKLIVEIRFGSQLYGTQTQLSDSDIRGVFLPCKKHILLGQIPKRYHDSTKRGHTKNTHTDVDLEYYSLHTFIQMACEGQIAAMDMLHAPKAMLIKTSPLWQQLVKHRDKFYTHDIQALLAYVKKQTQKYGVPGSSIHTLKQLIKLFKKSPQQATLKSLWTKLPQSDSAFYINAIKHQGPYYQIMKRQFQETAKISYLLPILEGMLQSLGQRASLATENKEIDWKAVSHAFRAIYQSISIFKHRTIEYPLKESRFLIQIKQGQLDYLSEVEPKLEKLLIQVKTLSQSSDLPSEVNRSFWEQWMIRVMEKEIVKKTSKRTS